MSTSSANATGLPDRRHFLSTVAGAGALGMTAMPALAQAPGPIEAMWPEHLRLEAEYDDACERSWGAEEKYEEPEKPKWHPFHEEGGYKLEVTDYERKKGTCYLDDSEENIAYLKDCIAREYEPDAEDSGCRNKLRARRARKSLAKIEAWQAEVRRRKHRAGLTKAEAGEEAARTAAYTHRDAILAVEATTYRELAFQAAILNIDCDVDQERAERVLDRLIELAGVSPHGPA